MMDYYSVYTPTGKEKSADQRRTEVWWCLGLTVRLRDLSSSKLTKKTLSRAEGVKNFFDEIESKSHLNRIVCSDKSWNYRAWLATSWTKIGDSECRSQEPHDRHECQTQARHIQTIHPATGERTTRITQYPRKMHSKENKSGKTLLQIKSWTILTANSNRHVVAIKL